MRNVLIMLFPSFFHEELKDPQQIAHGVYDILFLLISNDFNVHFGLQFSIKLRQVLLNESIALVGISIKGIRHQILCKGSIFACSDKQVTEGIQLVMDAVDPITIRRHNMILQKVRNGFQILIGDQQTFGLTCMLL